MTMRDQARLLKVKFSAKFEMDIQSLLGDMPASKFVEEYFHRLPFTRHGTSRSLCKIGTWEILGEILGQPHVDVMVVREGRQYDGPDPTTIEAARALHGEGYTILVRHAERHHAPIRRLADAFVADFDAPVNIHLYATPPGHFGFSWHYDAENVFILQTSGKKEYLLRKNTVHPWPLVETISQDMRYQHEIMPLMRVLLTAGDWLYIPCGYWHKAEAGEADETAISLAVGVMSPSAIDVYDFLRARLLGSLRWRQRLPVSGAASHLSPDELASLYRDLVDQLADDLGKTLREEDFLHEFLSR